MHFGSAAIQWCKKFAFTDSKTEHRITSKIEDFLGYRDGFKGRVDVLSVHDLDVFQQGRIFANNTWGGEKDTPVIDECLYFPTLELVPIANGEYLFVGLPNIHAAYRHWQSSTSPVEDVLWVKWTLQYLRPRFVLALHCVCLPEVCWRKEVTIDHGGAVG